MEEIPEPPHVKKERAFEDFENDLKYVRSQFYKMQWDYKSILLKFSDSPKEFYYLFNLPINQTAQFIIKKVLGD